MHLTGLVNRTLIDTPAVISSDENEESKSSSVDSLFNTIPLKNSPSYLFECIQELGELNHTGENYESKLEASQELCLNFYIMNNKKIDQCLWESLFSKSTDGSVSQSIEKIIYKVCMFFK